MKYLYSLLAFCALSLNAHAQDTIRRINGNYILAHIDTVGKYDIRYHYFTDRNHTRRLISKSLVSGITYADGRQDTLFVMDGLSINERSPMLHLPDDTLFQLGRQDAMKYYQRYHGSATGTFLATFPGSPLLGAIVGGSCALTPPKEKNMNFPNAALSNNPSYHEGYIKKARSIKNARIWRAFGIGVLINVILFAATNLG